MIIPQPDHRQRSHSDVTKTRMGNTYVFFFLPSDCATLERLHATCAEPRALLTRPALPRRDAAYPHAAKPTRSCCTTASTVRWSVYQSERTKWHSRAEAKHCKVEARHARVPAIHPAFSRSSASSRYSRNNRTPTLRPLILDRPSTSAIPFARDSGTSTRENRSST